MADIIDFKPNNIKFIEDLEDDSYLKSTCVNLLNMAGYHISVRGVKKFQQDNKLEETGIFGYDEMSILMVQLPGPHVQEILTYVDNKKHKPKKISKKYKILFSIWITLFFFVFIYGAISLYTDIYHKILNILFK